MGLIGLSGHEDFRLGLMIRRLATLYFVEILGTSDIAKLTKIKCQILAAFCRSAYHLETAAVDPV